MAHYALPLLLLIPVSAGCKRSAETEVTTDALGETCDRLIDHNIALMERMRSHFDERQRRTLDEVVEEMRNTKRADLLAACREASADFRRCSLAAKSMPELLKCGSEEKGRRERGD